MLIAIVFVVVLGVCVMLDIRHRRQQRRMREVLQMIREAARNPDTDPEEW